MRYLILLLLFFSCRQAYSCSCRSLTIQERHHLSDVIFYGKYIGKDTIKNLYDILGQAYVVDQFEVTTYYRGIDSALWEKIKKHSPVRVSVLAACHQPCGICFEKDKHYLVYTHKSYYKNFLSVDGCSSRKIEDGNFKIKGSTSTDYNKDENEELLKLSLTDTLGSSLSYNDRDHKKVVFLEEELFASKKETESKNLIIYTLIFLLGSLLVYLSIFRRRLSKWP